jgi:hypothetical protein
MSNRVVNLHIDRIVLNGLDISPGRADSLRSSIGQELQKALAEGGQVEGMTAGSFSRISIPAVKASDLGSEAQIAGSVARSVHSALGSRRR